MVILMEHYQPESSYPRSKFVLKKRAQYNNDFDISVSRVPDHNDITESMLEYSKKMSHISQTRGLYRGDNSIELPLLVKATHLPVPHQKRPNRSEGKSTNRTLHKPYPEMRARSLPNMRLEPLLGSKQKYKLSTASLMDLKSIRAVQMRQYRRKFLAPVDPELASTTKPENRINSDEGVATQHENDSTEEGITTKLTSDNRLASPDQTADYDSISVTVTSGQASDVMSVNDRSLVREKELSPLSLPKPKYRVLGNPRKTKRMKFHTTSLESIEEHDDIEKLPRSGSYNRLPIPKIFNQLHVQETDLYFGNVDDASNRKRDVAMLKKVNYGSKSNRQVSQMSIQALARKKLRRIPPIIGDQNAEDT